jgi:hypothetical protein
MALRTPPSWLQNGSHPAENDRLSTQALYATTGIVGSTSLAPIQHSTPNMSIDLGIGWAAIVGTTQANMGVYVGYNDALLNAPISTAPGANSRIDLVCLTVNDAFYTGVLNNLVLNVVVGTVAVSPTVPATPANSIALAQVLVGTSVASIVTANITDVRVNTTTHLPTVATAFTTAGDTVYGTGAGTFTKLAIGTALQVLRTNAGATAPEWATAGGGSGLVLIKRATLTAASNSSTTFDGVFTSTYKVYKIVIDGLTLSTGDAYLYLQYRASAVTKSGANYYSWGRTLPTSPSYDWASTAATQHIIAQGGSGADSISFAELTLSWQLYPVFTGSQFNLYRNLSSITAGSANFNATTDGFILSTSAGTVTANISVYGLAIV